MKKAMRIFCRDLRRLIHSPAAMLVMAGVAILPSLYAWFNIAANIDLAVIVVAAKEPPLHPKFIDRYLMILENSKIPAIICLNKCDLKTEEEKKIISRYRDLGIKVIETSTYKNIGINELKSELKFFYY